MVCRRRMRCRRSTPSPCRGGGSEQPAAFADLGETVDVSAQVRDAETPIEELSFSGRHTVGTFEGTGRSVTWKAPDEVERTPAMVTISVKVVEKLGYPGQAEDFSARRYRRRPP